MDDALLVEPGPDALLGGMGIGIKLTTLSTGIGTREPSFKLQ